MNKDMSFFGMYYSFASSVLTALTFCTFYDYFMNHNHNAVLSAAAKAVSVPAAAAAAIRVVALTPAASASAPPAANTAIVSRLETKQDKSTVITLKNPIWIATVVIMAVGSPIYPF